MKKRLYRNDVILNVIVVLVCLCVPLVLMMTKQQEGAYAVIMHGGEQVEKIALDEEREYTVNGVTITVKDESAYVVNSDCPDGTCVKMGKIRKSGQSIVCVPNRVSVKIQANYEKDGADVVAG